IRSHFALVLAELIAETQYGNTECIFYFRIDTHCVFIARQNFTECAHGNRGASIVAHILLVLFAKAGGGERGTGNHTGSAAAFVSVGAKKIRTLIEISKARHVKSAGAAIVERAWLANKILHEARHRWP